MEHKKTSKELIESSLTKKMIFASMGTWLLGKESKVRFRGSVDEVKAMSAALLATKEFHWEINRPDATMESVSIKLREKQSKTAEFERVVGIPWPL